MFLDITQNNMSDFESDSSDSEKAKAFEVCYFLMLLKI
jgi:hypothetical protein